MKSNNKPKQSTNNKKRIIGDSGSRLVAGTFLGLMLAIFASPLFCSDVFAEDSITVTIDNPNLNVNVAPKNTNGTFAKSNDSTISVKTTNATGYTLGIKANDGTNYDKLINGSEALSSITEATTEDQFKALAGTGYNGMWGYLPSKLNSSANTDFLPAPMTTGDTLDETTAANSTPNTYTLAIGARVDTSQKLGSYSNTYVIYASANAISYSIVYDDNVVSNMPTDENSGQAAGGVVSIAGNTPTRDGYKFLGWCTVAVATPASSASDCTAAGGQYYAAGSTTTITVATAFHLYAMWREPVYIQNFTKSQCQSLASSADYTVTDSRDGKDYTVQYINDACWMTQNLAIEPGTEMTADDTNITSDQYNNTTYYALPGTGYDLRTNASRTSDNCYGAFSSYTYAGNGWKNACTHVANATDVSEAGSSACGGSTCTTTQIGAWYNYPAATAGTIATKGDNSNVDQYNICPKGWTLPTYSQQSGITSYASSFSPLYGGFYNNGSHIGATTDGYWWSATTSNAYNRYSSRYYSGSLSYGYGINRHIGNYVRCVRTS